MILFWFGIFAENLVILVIVGEYKLYGYSTIVTPIRGPFLTDLSWLNPINFAYMGFGHFVHIFSAYWLAKGVKKGLILSFSISLFEIVSFLIPPYADLLTPSSITIRILFAVIIYLMISGRKELVRLQSENWRPWKNPKMIDESKLA
jgi:hypothetical protein